MMVSNATYSSKPFSTKPCAQRNAPSLKRIDNNLSVVLFLIGTDDRESINKTARKGSRQIVPRTPAGPFYIRDRYIAEQ